MIYRPGEWIPNPLKKGEVTVKCHTCETVAEFDDTNQVYECECDFGASVEGLALGLSGYEWTNDE